MSNLLNKIPVLDKGYVVLIDRTYSVMKKRALADEFFKGQLQNVDKISSMSLGIKMPLFIQLNLSKFDFKIIDIPSVDIEAFMPDQTQIQAEDLETSKLISDDIKATTEALLVNPHAYVADGCDNFMAQVIMPISLYNSVIVTGTVEEWKKFCKQSNAPKVIQAYMKTIAEIIKADEAYKI